MRGPAIRAILQCGRLAGVLGSCVSRVLNRAANKISRNFHNIQRIFLHKTLIHYVKHCQLWIRLTFWRIVSHRLDGFIRICANQTTLLWLTLGGLSVFQLPAEHLAEHLAPPVNIVKFWRHFVVSSSSDCSLPAIQPRLSTGTEWRRGILISILPFSVSLHRYSLQSAASSHTTHTDIISDKVQNIL